MGRTAAWPMTTWRAAAGYFGGSARGGPVGGVLLGLLAALAAVASVVELTAARGPLPRLAAERLQQTAGSGVLGVQLLFAVGLFGAATALPLLRLRPAAAGPAVTAAVLGTVGAFHTATAVGTVAVLLAHYRMGRTGRTPLALGLALPFPLLALAAAADTDLRVRLWLLAALAPVAATAGLHRRSRAQRAAHERTRALALGAVAENAVRAERARIARELHDVVAHHVSMIAVRAETARLATPDLPAQGAERLLEIGDAARDALAEMRRLLGVLREDGRAAPARAPQPGLAALGELLEQARRAGGGTVRLVVRGTPAPLDPGAELAAYRIVQEALTNARRHAPGAAVEVELHHTATALELRVRDHGPGPGGGPRPGGGHGLTGMRERAAAVGGTLRTGPGPGGGFAVTAHLPRGEAR
ncbi:sensor histidine kinase [Kitasatospora phosalacinea]|uniref:sensor histidine kinase n=1 Tax=Kitasatospora phosalacinea TaxID=2065 RepID=UPI0025553CF7|nr:histidine kinase [Kitasatospora phosalacinea]